MDRLHRNDISKHSPKAFQTHVYSTSFPRDPPDRSFSKQQFDFVRVLDIDRFYTSMVNLWPRERIEQYADYYRHLLPIIHRRDCRQFCASAFENRSRYSVRRIALLRQSSTQTTVHRTTMLVPSHLNTVFVRWRSIVRHFRCGTRKNLASLLGPLLATRNAPVSPNKFPSARI